MYPSRNAKLYLEKKVEYVKYIMSIKNENNLQFKF